MNTHKDVRNSLAEGERFHQANNGSKNAAGKAYNFMRSTISSRNHTREKHDFNAAVECRRPKTSRGLQIEGSKRQPRESGLDPMVVASIDTNLEDNTVHPSCEGVSANTDESRFKNLYNRVTFKVSNRSVRNRLATLTTQPKSPVPEIRSETGIEQNDSPLSNYSSDLDEYNDIFMQPVRQAEKTVRRRLLAKNAGNTRKFSLSVQSARNRLGSRVQLKGDLLCKSPLRREVIFHNYEDEEVACDNRNIAHWILWDGAISSDDNTAIVETQIADERDGNQEQEVEGIHTAESTRDMSCLSVKPPTEDPQLYLTEIIMITSLFKEHDPIISELTIPFNMSTNLDIPYNAPERGAEPALDKAPMMNGHWKDIPTEIIKGHVPLGGALPSGMDRVGAADYEPGAHHKQPAITQQTQSAKLVRRAKAYFDKKTKPILYKTSKDDEYHPRRDDDVAIEHKEQPWPENMSITKSLADKIRKAVHKTFKRRGSLAFAQALSRS